MIGVTRCSKILYASSLDRTYRDCSPFTKTLHIQFYRARCRKHLEYLSINLTLAYTAISIKVVHEQSGKVEYARERLLGIPKKLILFHEFFAAAPGQD
jgi:hypothetical protein